MNIHNTGLPISIDLNVLNHLGIGLYSNTPAVLTEIVANAWDADAHLVDVTIAENKIIIKDDGHGMDRTALETKFLTVGYDRRNHGEEESPDGRQCMGRKGIGKLAMFSLAHKVSVITKTVEGPVSGFIVYVDELKKKIEQKEPYYTTTIFEFSDYPEAHNIEKGTIIYLDDLQNKVDNASAYFKQRIARRFSVIGERENFFVKVNNSLVTLKDRGFYHAVQFLWTFGDDEEETVELCTNAKKIKNFDGSAPSGNQVSGFIASVKKPEQLRYDDGNNNVITLMANGRIFEEDIKARLDDSRVFNSYLVGELRYDVIDDNARPDIAVSSRQGVQENDPRFQEFIGYIQTRMNDISSDWDDWRRELGAEEIVEEFPKVNEWLETLPSSLKIRARQLITRVNTMRFGGSVSKQKEQRREVLKSQILAFEKLKLNYNLEAVDKVDFSQSFKAFQDLMVSVQDLEASLYWQITSQRLAVIKKLDQAQADSVKERIVQDHIYQNLWLVDSRWEYKQFETQYEKTLTAYLKKAVPDTKEGARFDIGYRSTSGRFVVMELKKPGLTVNATKLIEQGERYYLALKQFFKDHPSESPTGEPDPYIDVILVVDRTPSSMNDLLADRLVRINGRILTYRGIVQQAYSAYEDYLAASQSVSRIDAILEAL
ncbi:ATP-binding protein [Salinicola sp. CR57]|uniref:BbrUII/HgiDII family restriction enzyme n=1 Tax=Salinicola sp. CR57 TaxID=1949086 RepID=UPI000DA1B3F4|nr:ATP-binding protein [Salinicola sp. CR57]